MIGVLGGTFDPVHFGHLRAALEIYESLGLHEVRLVPCGQPPHREMPRAGAAQRLAMVERAVAGQPGLVVDRRELQRDGPSYSVLTLRELRAELGDTPVAMIVGRDAFAGLDRWWHWEEILDLCHIIVVERQGAQAALPRSIAGLLDERRAVPERLTGCPAGHILCRRVTALDISATRIRDMVAAGRSPRYLLPEAVLDFITDQSLYTEGH